MILPISTSKPDGDAVRADQAEQRLVELGADRDRARLGEVGHRGALVELGVLLDGVARPRRPLGAAGVAGTAGDEQRRIAAMRAGASAILLRFHVLPHLVFVLVIPLRRRGTAGLVGEDLREEVLRSSVSGWSKNCVGGRLLDDARRRP